MSVINGKSYSTPRAINLRDGLLRFDSTNASNPFGDLSYGIYVDASGNLIYRNLTTSTTLGAAGSGGGAAPSWDSIYNGDKTLAVSSTTFTIDGTHATNNALTLTMTGAGTGHALQITNVGSGKDINGTSDTWSVSKAGDAIFNTVTFAGDADATGFTLTIGDFVISDGSVAITNADNEATFSVTNNGNTTASMVVIAGSGAYTGNTTSSFMTLTSGATTGTVLYIPVTGVTTGKGINLIGTTALTTGILLNIESGTTGISLTGAGRMVYVNHTGTATSTGILSEFASAATDETVILKVTASGALALGTAVAVSASGLTTGFGLTLANLDSLTSGIGVHIASSATAITGAGRLLYVNHTGVTSSTGTLVEFATLATDAANATTLLKLTMGASIVGLGLSIASTTGLTTGSLIRTTTSTAGAIATNGIISIRATGAYTSTSNAGLVDIQASATVLAATVVNIQATNAGQTDTTLLNVVSSGYTAAFTGNVVNISGTSTTGASNVVLITGDNTTAGNVLKVVSGATTTNGRGILLQANALTTGVGFGFAHTTSVIADGGSMVRLSSSSIDTGGATNGTMLDIVATGATAATLVKMASSTAAQTAVTILDINSSGYTTGFTGSVVKMTGASTTGSGNVLLVTSANTTAGEAVKIDAAAVTTGTGLLVTSAGVIVTTGELVSLVANGATTSTGVLRISATALTDGWVAELTGGGATATASGGVLNLLMGVATDGSGLKVSTTGVYIGTVGVAVITANSATSGNIAVINGTGLTTGTALLINTTTATLTSGFYIRCNDGAATDFSVGDFGATVITGSALGTAALTLTSGDILASAGTIKSASATGGVGYATGAGGTVTQITNRSTGVTINTICGKIQTDTTSLAALASAEFTVTNSTVEIGDVVVVSQRSGSSNVAGVAGTTVVEVVTVAAGSFIISVNNQSTSTAETGAIIINFAVIKSVTA